MTQYAPALCGDNNLRVDQDRTRPCEDTSYCELTERHSSSGWVAHCCMPRKARAIESQSRRFLRRSARTSITSANVYAG
jgi:hypothetical protein